MPRKPDAYYRPSSVEEALTLLRQPNTIPLAGGTSLLATEEGVYAAVVDLQDCGLDVIEYTANETQLAIGAMVRLTDIDVFLRDASEASPAALLRQATHQAGPNTYRNAATIGGVVADRLPDSELLAALLALDATLTLLTPGESQVWLADYLAAGERPAGLIVSVTVPWLAGKGHSERVARTPADYPIVSLTGWQPIGEAPRLAATGIGPRALRLSAAEAAVADALTADTIRRAAGEAAAATAHPGDFRGSAGYRADMAEVLTRRVLTALS